MKPLFISIFFVCFSGCIGCAQRIDVDLFGGLSNYQGDLQPIFLTLNQSQAAGFLVLKYGISEHIYIRTGFAIASLSGNDNVNKSELKLRNLRFRTSIKEFHVAGEYRFIKPDNFPFSPYVFLGAGVFHFNPYTYVGNQKVYLQPLGTEGQGLPQYPQKKLYSLTQACIVYGLGFKYEVNKNLNLGFEFCHRKLFTDYLDDASGTFADENVLRNARGQLAVDLAFRRHEIDPSKPYPNEGNARANPKGEDWYYFAGLTIGLRLTDAETGGFSLGGIFKGSGRRGRSRTGCPVNVW